MAVIASNTTSNANGPVVITATTLGASDTLTYNSGTGQVLHLHNSTAGILTVVIDGASGTTVSVPGTGGASLDVSAGLSVALTAGQRKSIRLDTIYQYLQGAVTLSGASGLTAYITV